MNRAFGFLLLLIVSMGGLFAQEEQERDALQAFRDGRYADAIRITELELESSPANMDAYAVQGWALLSLGRWTATIASSQRALEISPYDSRIIAIMAEAQYGLGNNLSALKYIQDYIAVSPNGSVVAYMYQLMGEIHIRFEEYHSADIALSTSLYYEPGNARIWQRLGFAREQTGDSDHALEAYRQALELNGNLEEAREALARIENS